MAPLCVCEPFQRFVTVCPLANDHVNIQAEIGVVPVLLIVIAAVKPLGHWLLIV